MDYNYVNVASSATSLKKMYNKLTYFDSYGSSVFLCMILIIILFIIHSYCMVMNRVQPIKENWAENRCRPEVIPFAGLINKPANKTATDYAAENFAYCTQNMLVPVSTRAVNPFTFMADAFLEVFELIAEAIQFIRKEFFYVRNSFLNIAADVMNKLLNFVVPIQQIMMGIRDMLAKVIGIAQVALNTGLGSFYTLKSLLGNIATFSLNTILAGLGILIALIILIPFFPFLLIPATSYLVAYAVIASLLAILLVFMEGVLKVYPDINIPSAPALPSVNSCFDRNTMILMKSGTRKRICDVVVGDVLYYDGKVTATFKLSAYGMQIYELFGIQASGYHRVKFQGRWIYVNQHPNATLLSEYEEPYIYCLNTESKRICIEETSQDSFLKSYSHIYLKNKIVFMDWDEIVMSITDLLLLNESFESENKYESKYKYKRVDGGFVSTSILLWDGTSVDISKVKVGDVLFNGEKVYGTVIVDGTDIEQYDIQYYSEPIPIPDKEKINVNVLANIVPERKDRKIKIKKSPQLYHLLTNTKTFVLKGITYNDYNFYVDGEKYS